jgi:hypothetical protein
MGRIPEKFAVMTVDPGGTTGVAQGLFNTRGGRLTIRSLVGRAVRKEAVRVAEVVPAREPGPRAESAHQAAILYRAWLDFNFKATVELGVSVPDVHLVIEDFQLRQRSAELSPVEVTHAFLAYLRGETGTWAAMSLTPAGRLHFQAASEAKTYATNERLKLWGAYGLTVGKEHGRDAARHLILRASKILDGEDG